MFSSSEETPGLPAMRLLRRQSDPQAVIRSDGRLNKQTWTNAALALRRTSVQGRYVEPQNPWVDSERSAVSLGRSFETARLARPQSAEEAAARVLTRATSYACTNRQGSRPGADFPCSVDAALGLHKAHGTAGCAIAACAHGKQCARRSLRPHLRAAVDGEPARKLASGHEHSLLHAVHELAQAQVSATVAAHYCYVQLARPAGILDVHCSKPWQPSRRFEDSSHKRHVHGAIVGTKMKEYLLWVYAQQKPDGRLPPLAAHSSCAGTAAVAHLWPFAAVSWQG